MITAKVWNSEKLASYYQGEHDCKSLEAINDYENNTGYGLSSEITANNEEHLYKTLSAIYNETDCNLSYHIIEKDTPK